MKLLEIRKVLYTKRNGTKLSKKTKVLFIKCYVDGDKASRRKVYQFYYKGKIIETAFPHVDYLYFFYDYFKVL